MILGKKIIVVLPAYNAGKTLRKTINEIPKDIVDDIVLVDDYSLDNTIEIAEELEGIHIIKHLRNSGYGANQKTCYKTAIELNADIVVMLHPDYQYTPKLIHSMSYLIANNVYQVVLGSRILGKGAVRGGMPKYKYFFNRVLTFFQNIIMSQKLSEYHTGYRAFSIDIIKELNLEANSDDFVFDNQMLAQIFMAGHNIAEITCPTHYFADASSINFMRSLKYGAGCMKTACEYRLHKWRLINIEKFKRPVPLNNQSDSDRTHKKD